MSRATTTTTANKFKMLSEQSRPATDGNKNIFDRSQRTRSMGPDQKRNIAEVFAKTHSGPFLGRRSL